MTSDRLTSFSYTVLVLIGRGGAGPHDLVRMARQGRVYAGAADSQYYAEPKRLKRLGYLTSRKTPGKTRERTHYELTPQAYEALERWAREPVRFPGVATEPIVRLMAADLVGQEPVLESLRGMRSEIGDLFARLDVAEAVAATLPHRERYLLLNHRLARNILQAHLDWLDEVEREIGRDEAGAGPPPERRPTP